MSYFSIAAPQTVVLPDGTQLHFRINPADSSLVEIHLAGEHNGETGTHIVTFKRNGGQTGKLEFVPVEAPKSNPAQPLAGYKSVNDDAVREPLVAENGQVKPALPPDRTVTSTSLKDDAQPRNDLKPETA